MQETGYDEKTSQYGTPGRPLAAYLFYALGALLLMLALLALAAAAFLPEQQLTAVLERADSFLFLNGDAPADPRDAPQADPAAAPTPTLLPSPSSPQPGGRSAGDPYMPEIGSTGYDVLTYTLRITLDPAVEHISATVTIDAVADLHGLSELSLDFIGYEVAALTMEGAAVPFQRENGKLIVTLPRWLAIDEPFSLTIAYQGEPEAGRSNFLLTVEHLGYHFPDGESIFTIAQPDGARYWFPCNDHPRDKAAFRFELLVPAGLTAVANGRLLSTRAASMPGGNPAALFSWAHDYPMAPYLAVVAVGRYQNVLARSPSGVPLRHYVLDTSDMGEFTRAAADIPEALDWMASLLGPYPFETFGYVTAKVPGVAMETQTTVLLPENLLGPRTAVHELAHMWFGDWVGLDSWSEMWRNEGFATYLTFMWFTRGDPEQLELEIASALSAAEVNGRAYPLRYPPPEKLFDFNVYYESAAIIHALRQEMGDDAFFAGLRLYFERYGGQNASDARFKEVMEEAAGFSLDPFFDQWLPAP